MKTNGLILIAALLWAAGCDSKDPLLVTGTAGTGAATVGNAGRGGTGGMSAGDAGRGGAAGDGPGGAIATGGTPSGGTTGGAQSGGAGGALAACAPKPATILNPCVFAATAPGILDLTVRGTLTSVGTTRPVGLRTLCLHTSSYYITVQDAAGQSTAVGYDVAGAPPSSLAGLVGQTVTLRARLATQFQIDTDSVGVALQDGAGGLVFAVYGGTVRSGMPAQARPDPAELQGIEVTVADPLCSAAGACGPQTYHALQFRGSSTITLASGASGTVAAGGSSYVAHHVATYLLGPQGCTDQQDWQSWSLLRDDAL